MRESKASAEDKVVPSDYKESCHQLQMQKDSLHIKGSKQSPNKNGDGRTSKERDRDRQREHEKEAEKEKERLREREIRAFREFSKDLPFKQPTMPQIRRVAGSSYLPSSDFDIDENASHLPIPNILSNGLNSSSNSSNNSSSNCNHVGSSNGSGDGNNDGNNGPSSGTYYNTGTGGHMSLGPLGDTGIRLRGGLTGAPGPASLAMSTGRPQIPSIECRSAALQGNSGGGMNAHPDTTTSQGQGQGYHGSSSSTDNGNNVVNSSNSNSSSNSSSSSRSSSHLNLNGSNSLSGSSSTLNIPGVPYRHQPQPLGNIPVQHSASNLSTQSQSQGQGQNSSNNKYRDNPLSGSNNAYTAPIGPLTITTATATASASSTLSCHSILGQNTELTSSSAFDDDIRHSGASSSSATHANTMAPGEHSFNAHNRLNSKGSLFDVRSDASFFSESDSTNYSTINSTMSTVMGVSTGSTRTGDMNAISSLMNMNGFISSAASSHMGSASVSATSTLTMNLNTLNIRDRGAAGQSLLDPLDALHYSQLPLQTLPQIRDGNSNDMMTADSKTSTGTGTHLNGNGVSNTCGDGAPSLHGLGGIQGSKQHTRSRDHKHGTRNGKGKSSARSNQITSNPHIQSQHQHSTRALTHMQDKGTGGGAPKFR